MTRQLTDKELVQQIVDGSEIAFAALWKRYRDKVRGHVVGILQRGGIADRLDEATNEVAFTIWQSCHTWAGEASFSTWLYRVTHNVALMMIRQKTLQKNRIVYFPTDAEWLGITQKTASKENTPEWCLQNKQEWNIIESCMLELDKGQRETLKMRLFEGLSIPEISRRTGRSAAAIKSRWYRGKETLKLLANKRANIGAI